MLLETKYLLPVFEAWGPAGAITHFKADEDAARQGYNRPLTIFSQSLQISFLVESVLKIEKAVGHGYFSAPLQIVAYISPLIIGGLDAFLSKLEKDGIVYSPYLKRSVSILHQNFGSLCQVAFIVSNVALLHLGFTAYASTSLSFSVLGYLHRHRMMNLKFREIFHNFPL